MTVTSDVDTVVLLGARHPEQRHPLVHAARGDALQGRGARDARGQRLGAALECARLHAGGAHGGGGAVVHDAVGVRGGRETGPATADEGQREYGDRDDRRTPHPNVAHCSGTPVPLRHTIPVIRAASPQ